MPDSVKIGFLGDSSTQLMSGFLRKELDLFFSQYSLFEGDYNQIERQIFDESSELFQFRPDILIIFKNSHHLFENFVNIQPMDRPGFADQVIHQIVDIVKKVNQTLKCRIIFCNFYELNDPAFGNFANKTPCSFVYQVRKINMELMDLSIQYKNFYICDVASVLHNRGTLNSFDPRTRVLADMPLNLDTQKIIIDQFMSIFKVMYGNIKKCLILDLDNTLWGGIIGDDGPDKIQIGELGIGKAFTAVQQYAKLLKDRGIILAVCSKNSETLAKEPFYSHPDMVLRMEDISIFVANWDNKADNIRKIQKTLNIGFDAMVFIDDNPFERDMVKQHIPDITVPDLPEDPAEYFDFLVRQNLFEVSSFSEEDFTRTQQYQIEAKRTEYRQSFETEEAFLENLEMKSKEDSFNSYSIPRVVQLIQRSNQFNLRTIRYSESEIESISNSDQHKTFYFTLKDKYGNHGIVSLIILSKDASSLFIDTWIMSCRVLKRSMESYVLNRIIKFARENGFEYLIGEYIPSKKNILVADLYKELGFIYKDNYWTLAVKEYKEKPTFIHLENE